MREERKYLTSVRKKEKISTDWSHESSTAMTFWMCDEIRPDRSSNLSEYPREKWT